MARETWKVAGLLFFSGACALIYQTVWLRQFRLIFGASTFSTAAVLAIFMAGLGIGSSILGRRADRQPRPLEFYGNLELLIAASAAVSPFLLLLVAKLYIALGGSTTLGLPLATLVRLILSALVLGIPTFLMGGTLPAAARAVESPDDSGRRRLALLYGTNTLGAVFGTLISTFAMLELFGNRKTLFIAVLCNALVAILARSMARARPPIESEADGAPPSAGPVLVVENERPVSAHIVYSAAALVGFAFLLMELVWYRMLSPILGGTTFMFGLILAVALLGIGLGGAAYSVWGRGLPSAKQFALTCALEALAMAFPFVLGDRLAFIAFYLRPLGFIGFHGYVIGWTLVTMVVVFPAAFIAGVQFPMLIALLGRGREKVGRDVGTAYAWNTAGAILGSLAGGFGFLPLLSAPGAWRLTFVMLAALSIFFLVISRRERAFGLATMALVAAALAIAGAFAPGPTAVWRHSGIGAGRAMIEKQENKRRDWENAVKRTIVWEADGRESSIALKDADDLAFIVNGKSDGSARGDAGTQIMSGVIGALIHPYPRRTFVIGLGTGSTAGWLASMPTMERVDVVELEPVVLDVARACATVNQNVLENPKVHIEIADAREVLLATRGKYDLVFSEPSNPYRAGIASLFTQEFYQAAADRMNPNGVFLQWVQAYDIDAPTLHTIYATISSVFPHVDTWWTNPGDLVLMASREPIVIDVNALRYRIAQQPYRSATSNAWRVESAEGVLAHFVGSPVFTRALAKRALWKNTDDQTVIEFGFGRAVAANTGVTVSELVLAAQRLKADRPLAVRGNVDWALVDANHAGMARIGTARRIGEEYARRDFAAAYEAENLREAYRLWQTSRWKPVNSFDAARLADVLSDVGSEEAIPFIEMTAQSQPIEADMITARLLWRRGRPEEAVPLLERAFTRYRQNPWPVPQIASRSLETAVNITRDRPALGPRLYEALRSPFAAAQWEDYRQVQLAMIAYTSEQCGQRTLEAMRALEPHVPWREGYLEIRHFCYEATGQSGLAARAREDLEEFRANEPTQILE